MQPMRCARFVGVSATLFLAACGCNAMGYPAIDGLVQDRVTGRPVAMAGATVRYSNELQAAVERVVPAADTGNRLWLCCTPGRWRVQIDQAGYVPFDTSLRVRAEGRCDRPVLVRLIARLQPRPVAASRRAPVGRTTG